MVAAAIERQVWQRARGRCEYCLMPAGHSSNPFQIDHIIAQKHEGETVAEKLALSCWRCNVHKGTNIAGIDPQTRAMSRLFHPRQDRWVEHFIWDGCWLRGLTAVGRTTLAVLRINDSLAGAARAALMEEGLFPPSQ